METKTETPAKVVSMPAFTMTGADVDLAYSVAVAERMKFKGETMEQAEAAVQAQRQGGDLPPVETIAEQNAADAERQAQEEFQFRCWLEAICRKDCGAWRGLSIEELQDQAAAGDGCAYQVWRKRRGLNG